MIRSDIKNVDPPFWVAWNQALASIRVRFLRHAVTSVGVALGSAFFASVQTLRMAEAGKATGDPSRLQWLVATSLAMCLVGVTNSMLMSVTERYREIGTIKCLGASDSFIVRVFFLEAAVLGVLGSLVGSFAGAGLMAIGVRFAEMSVTFGQVMTVTFVGAGLGLLITVLAAIAPAIQAAKMPAAAALRMDV